MKNFTQKLEAGFEKWGAFATRHPLKTIITIVILSVLVASNLKNVTIDTSTEGLFHDNDPALILYEEFMDNFGRDERIVLAVLPPEVFTESFLNKFIKFHQKLEETVPNLVSIDSLVNARSTIGTEDSLLVSDLMEEFIEGQEDPEELKKRVMNNRQYINRLISEDGKFVTLLLQMSYLSSAGETDTDDLLDITESEINPDQETQVLTDEEQTALIGVIREVVAEFENSEFVVHLAGSPIVTDVVRKSMKKDMIKLTGFAVLIIGALLLILFRRTSGVLIPVTIVLLSLIVTLGLYPLTGQVVTTTVIILPSF
ncbi:MAG: MMPL family transporter, partial [Proteobacteria bacterium]|nr:MMPL family transporter [Pseudomonadota bacterium]